jgi:DNA polymerase-1
LYTEEAYLLCKKLEFKNLLARFEVQAPKNHAEDYFKQVESVQEAEKIFSRMEGNACGFFLVPGEKEHALLGIALAFGEEDIYYIPCTERTEESGNVTFSGADGQGSFLELLEGSAALEEEKVQSAFTKETLLEKFCNSSASVYATLDLKPQLTALGMIEKKQNGNISQEKLFDNTIAAYLMNPIKNEYPYEDIAKDYGNLMIPSKADLLGKLTFEKAKEDAPEAFLKCVCYMAYTAWKTREPLLFALRENEMEHLFTDIEMPLVFTLADMEDAGIIASGEALKEYGDKLSVRIAELEKQIYAEAGEEFNINSPKQLGVILFEKMNLPGGKKTKTGYSTAADVLERLAGEYPIVADILEYRQLTKLKSTYADGLFGYIREDGRIHTSFNQTITATGRLSSTEPNLQNIPMRIELGRLIRKAFYPKEGYVFVDADYSQIELRVLAHMSGDEKLIEAYRQAQDIHRITASQVFHIPFEEVTDIQRRNAKAVNFGIVYGISSFGLSQDLSISKKEAAEYIERYFETYPKIKTFLDGLVEDAKKSGYAVTMFGRRRPVPELSSSNFMQRSFGERIAMNSPIQGTAADIIKIAMIRVHDRILNEQLKSRLILTVHDELLVETARDEEEEIIKILTEEMQGAANLDVVLEIDAKVGTDWYEAK